MAKRKPKIVFDELGDKRPNGKNKTSFGEVDTHTIVADGSKYFEKSGQISECFHQIGFRAVESNCYSGEIYIDPRQSESELLDTLVHELLHLNFKYMSEKNVHNSASNIASTLWRMGYRRKK